MIRINLILTICSFSLITSWAQEITVTTDTLNEKEAKTKYKYQTIDQYDQRFLLKLGARDGFSYSFEYGFRDVPFDLFAFEYRLTKHLSLEGTYFFPVDKNSAFSFKLRHFLKGDRIADNLSGKYFALEYMNQFYRSESFNEIIFLQFGRQIKKSQFGYADMRVYGGYQFGPFTNSFNLGLNVTVGAAWGPIGKRSTIELPSDQNISSHREHLLITLESPSINIDLSNNFQSYGIGSTIEKEFLATGLTARTSIWGGYSRQTSTGGFFSKYMRFSISTGIRKYFGPLKKPNADEPVHAFAGLYVGAGFGSLYSYEDIEYFVINDSRDEIRQGFGRTIPYLSVGYKERMGKRYFFEMFAGYSFYTFTSFIENTKGDGYFYFGTQLGLNWGK